MNLDQYLIGDARLQAMIIVISLLVGFVIIWRFAAAAKAGQRIRHRWTLTFSIICALALVAVGYGAVSAIVHHDYANIVLLIFGSVVMYELTPKDELSELFRDNNSSTAKA
jgi:predicted neutral ceramidase superfamily lipid hydrolase